MNTELTNQQIQDILFNAGDVNVYSCYLKDLPTLEDAIKCEQSDQIANILAGMIDSFKTKRSKIEYLHGSVAASVLIQKRMYFIFSKSTLEDLLFTNPNIDHNSSEVKKQLYSTEFARFKKACFAKGILEEVVNSNRQCAGIYKLKEDSFLYQMLRPLLSDEEIEEQKQECLEYRAKKEHEPEEEETTQPPVATNVIPMAAEKPKPTSPVSVPTKEKEVQDEELDRIEVPKERYKTDPSPYDEILGQIAKARISKKTELLQEIIAKVNAEFNNDELEVIGYIEYIMKNDRALPDDTMLNQWAKKENRTYKEQYRICAIQWIKICRSALTPIIARQVNAKEQAREAARNKTSEKPPINPEHEVTPLQPGEEIDIDNAGTNWDIDEKIEALLS